MKRARWFNAEWTASIRSLANRIKAVPFTKDGFDGFVLDRVRDNAIEARYVEKLVFQEKIVDPFGNEESFERVSYRQTAFSIFSSFPSLQLLDSPRNTEGFTSKLLELSKFDLAISPLSVDALSWAICLEKKLNREVYIDSLRIAGLQLENGVVAKVHVRGDRDVRDALKPIIKGRTYTLENVQLRASLGGRKFAMVVTKGGGASFPEEFHTDLLPILRLTLNQIVGKK